MAENQYTESLFAKALELRSREERVRFLDEACANDSGLRGDVQTLLDAH